MTPEPEPCSNIEINRNGLVLDWTTNYGYDGQFPSQRHLFQYKNQLTSILFSSSTYTIFVAHDEETGEKLWERKLLTIESISLKLQSILISKNCILKISIIFIQWELNNKLT